MNEFYFFLQITMIIPLILFALKLGKEALIACFAIQVISANLFVTKQITCFGLNITCTDVYTISGLFTLNLLQEFYGKKAAKNTIWLVLFLLIFFIIMSQFQINYVPSKYDSMHDAFKKILDCTPRIMFSSFFVALFTQRIDVETFGFLKKKFPKKTFTFHFVGASLTSQALDTILFTFVALYGVVHNVGEIILMSYSVKIIAILSITPFQTFIKRLSRHDIFQV